MSGKRRTKKDKQRTSLRKSLSINLPIENSEVHTPTYSFLPESEKKVNQTVSSFTRASSNSLALSNVVTDAKKTLFITGAILAINTLLFLLYRNGLFTPKVFGL